MPLIVRKRGEKYRILERDTGRIARGPTGKALDHGGSRSASSLRAQARTRDPKTEMTSSRDVEALPLHRSSAGRRVGTLGKPRAVSILA